MISSPQRKGLVSIARQTVVNGRVVAVTVTQEKRVIYTGADKTEYITIKGKRVPLIKGMVVLGGRECPP